MSNHHARPLRSPARRDVADTRSDQSIRVSTVSDGQADRMKKKFIPGPSRHSSALAWGKMARVKGGIREPEEAPPKVPCQNAQAPKRSSAQKW